MMLKVNEKHGLRVSLSSVHTAEPSAVPLVFIKRMVVLMKTSDINRLYFTHKCVAVKLHQLVIKSY